MIREKEIHDLSVVQQLSMIILSKDNIKSNNNIDN